MGNEKAPQQDVPLWYKKLAEKKNDIKFYPKSTLTLIIILDSQTKDNNISNYKEVSTNELLKGLIVAAAGC